VNGLIGDLVRPTAEMARVIGAVAVELTHRRSDQRFAVFAGGRTVEVRGTAFRVSDKGGKFDVAVLRGRVAIIDFRLGSPVGPPARHRIAPKKVAEEMALAGYRMLEQHDFLPHQYFLVFAPR
jgi:ferric-dicitrate binding protein FerR (iron transport regulator)